MEKLHRLPAEVDLPPQRVTAAMAGWARQQKLMNDALTEELEDKRGD